MVNAIQVPLVKKEKLAEDTWAFYFSKPKDFTFTPGQYTTLTLPIIATDHMGSSRDFSIVSAAFEKDVMLVTRMGPSNFKKALTDMQPGNIATLTRPAGGFYIREENQGPQVLLAGGIGITVFRSMIVSLANKKSTLPITLIASFSFQKDIIFFDELEQIVKQNNNVKIIYTLSQGFAKGLGQGRISKELLHKYIPQIHTPIYMIAGPQEFVYAMQELVRGLGVSEEKIKIDIFTGY